MSTRADTKTIKKSYYDLGKSLCLLIGISILAKKYHPDTLKHATLKEAAEVKKAFQEITEAYSVLGSEENKAKYDRLILGSDTVNTSATFDNQEDY